MYTLQLFSPYSLLVILLAGTLSVVAGWAVWTSGRGGASKMRSTVLVSAAVLPFLLFLFAVGSLSVNVPYWDDYDAILGYLVRTFPERMEHFFALHNEHRIAFVRLVAEIIYCLLGTFDFRAMIYSGNALFLCYVLLVLARLRKNNLDCVWWAVAVSWSLLSILMYENMLWALTSVQNNAVLLFAWLALLCLDRGGHTGWYAASLFFGLACTYTSGSGLFIWFCMWGLALKRWLFERTCLSPMKWVLLAAVTGGAMTGYLCGFQGHSQDALSQAFAHPLSIATYAALFCGAAMNFSVLALPVGIAVLAVVLLLVFRIGRIRDNVSFFFLGFLLCAVFSAALFRCGDLPTQALSFRYRGVAVSIMVCCGLLVYEQYIKPLGRDTRSLCAVAAALCIFMNLSAYLLAYPQLVARRAEMVEGMKRWPAEASGLIYPDHLRAGKILERSVQQNIYKPAQ